MAVTASGLYLATLIDVLDTTQLALDLDLETHKGALFTDTVAPNFDTDTAYGVSPYDANEAYGTNWAQGGVALTGTALSVSPSGTMMYNATDVSEATVTLDTGTTAMAYLLYADALAGNNAIVLVDFVTGATPVAGTFSITWAGTGVFTIANP